MPNYSLSYRPVMQAVYSNTILLFVRMLVVDSSIAVITRSNSYYDTAGVSSWMQRLACWACNVQTYE
jgi:hypothetical protein